jgi:DNA-binding ferritin-like protein
MKLNERQKGGNLLCSQELKRALVTFTDRVKRHENLTLVTRLACKKRNYAWTLQGNKFQLLHKLWKEVQ